MQPKNIGQNALRLLLIFTVFSFITSACPGQSAIRGKIFNSKKEPAQSASVLLLRSKDSSLIKAIVSDANGVYAFDNVPTGNYLVQGSALGYKQTYSNIV